MAPHFVVLKERHSQASFLSGFYSCVKIFQAGITKILQNPTLIPQAKPSNSALPSLFEWSEGSHPKPLNIIQSAAAVTVSLLDFYSWPQKLSSPPESLVWLH